MRLVKSSLVLTALVGASLVPAGSLAQANHLPAPGDLTVRLTPKDVRAPDSVQAGRYRLEVQAPRRALASLTLVKPDRGLTLADLRHGRGNIAKHVRFFGGLTLRPDQTGVMWETLYAGRYWLMSETVGRDWRQRIETIRVHGAPSVSRFPRVAAEAFHRDNSTRITSRIPRSGRMLVRNTSPRLDAMVLLPLRDGATYRDFLVWVRSDGEGRSPLRFSGFRTTSLSSPRVGYVMRYRLRPGNWVTTDLRSLFGFGRPERLTQAFRPLHVRGGTTAGGPRYDANGFTSSPQQRRAVGRALERIARGRTLPTGRIPWHLLQP
jgi:hypothetical protein